VGLQDKYVKTVIRESPEIRMLPLKYATGPSACPVFSSWALSDALSDARARCASMGGTYALPYADAVV